jgi:predicted metalloprotease with PDZ domain
MIKPCRHHHHLSHTTASHHFSFGFAFYSNTVSTLRSAARGSSFAVLDLFGLHHFRYAPFLLSVTDKSGLLLHRHSCSISFLVIS